MAVVNEPVSMPVGSNPNDMAAYSTQILQTAAVAGEGMTGNHEKSVDANGGTLLLACVSCISPEVEDMGQAILSPVSLDDGSAISCEEKPIPTTRTDANFQVALSSTQASVIFEVRTAGSAVGENVIGRFALKPSSVKNTIDHRAAGWVSFSRSFPTKPTRIETITKLMEDAPTNGRPHALISFQWVPGSADKSLLEFAVHDFQVYSLDLLSMELRHAAAVVQEHGLTFNDHAQHGGEPVEEKPRRRRKSQRTEFPLHSSMMQNSNNQHRGNERLDDLFPSPGPVVGRRFASIGRGHSSQKDPTAPSVEQTATPPSEEIGDWSGGGVSGAPRGSHAHSDTMTPPSALSHTGEPPESRHDSVLKALRNVPGEKDALHAKLSNVGQDLVQSLQRDIGRMRKENRELELSRSQLADQLRTIGDHQENQLALTNRKSIEQLDLVRGDAQQARQREQSLRIEIESLRVKVTEFRFSQVEGDVKMTTSHGQLVTSRKLEIENLDKKAEILSAQLREIQSDVSTAKALRDALQPEVSHLTVELAKLRSEHSKGTNSNAPNFDDSFFHESVPELYKEAPKTETKATATEADVPSLSEIMSQHDSSRFDALVVEAEELRQEVANRQLEVAQLLQEKDALHKRVVDAAEAASIMQARHEVELSKKPEYALFIK